MSENNFRVYGYRWVVLAVFMLVNLALPVLWIGYAPITGIAAKFYGVSDLQIGLLAMVFQLPTIILAIPVSWLIDTYGFYRIVSIGAALLGIFGIGRGMAGANYNLVLWFSVGMAIAQPFIITAWMKVAAVWFPIKERATAVGLVTLAGLLGMALGMILTPLLIQKMSIPSVQLTYGMLGVVSAMLFVFLARSKPATPPCPEGMDERVKSFAGIKNAFSIRSFWAYLFCWFIVQGIFNGLSTWIENIVRPRGFSPTDAGTIGAMLLLGGLIGAIIIPPFSDRQQKRLVYMLWGMVLAVPGMLGLTFATSYNLLLLSAFSMGFVLIGTSPIGIQYAAEIVQPTPEGTTNGIMQMFAQGSAVFVFIMEAMKNGNGAFTPALMLSAGLMVLCVAVIAGMKEPKKA